MKNQDTDTNVRNNRFLDSLGELTKSDKSNENLESLNYVLHTLLMLYRNQIIKNQQNHIQLFEILKNYTEIKTKSGIMQKEEIDFTKSLLLFLTENQESIENTPPEPDLSIISKIIEDITTSKKARL